MRIVIIGAGAMGSLFAARLGADGTHEVWLLGRGSEHLTAIRETGLELVTPEGQTEHILVGATADPAEIPTPAGFILIAVKSYATRFAAERAAPLLAPDGLVLTLQNGVGNYEVIAAAIGAEQTVQGVTSQGATLLDAGRVRHAGKGPTYLATTPATAERVDRIARLFTSCGFPTQVTDDFPALVWGKLVVNAAINPLTALLRVPNGLLVTVPEARLLLEEVAREAAVVAEAAGVKLPYENPAEQAVAVAAATAANHSSMLADVLRGMPTEIEVVNGAIARTAAEMGLNAPLNKLLTELVRALEVTAAERVEK